MISSILPEKRVNQILKARGARKGEVSTKSGAFSKGWTVKTGKCNAQEITDGDGVMSSTCEVAGMDA